MPRYRTHAPFYDGTKLVAAGQEIEFDGLPGTKLEPLDDEAWDKLRELIRYRGSRGLSRLDFAFEVPDDLLQPRKAEAKSDPSEVEIPENWLDMRPEQVVNLARKLGAANNSKFGQAVAWIEKEIARRTEAKAA